MGSNGRLISVLDEEECSNKNEGSDGTAVMLTGENAAQTVYGVFRHLEMLA